MSKRRHRQERILTELHHEEQHAGSRVKPDSDENGVRGNDRYPRTTPIRCATGRATRIWIPKRAGGVVSSLLAIIPVPRSQLLSAKKHAVIPVSHRAATRELRYAHRLGWK